MAPLRTLIVENESLFRDMLRVSLEARPSVEVVADVGDGQSAILLANEFDLDLVLMDLHLGDGPSGVEAGIAIKRSRPEIGIVLLSMHREVELLASLPADVATGWSYLLKQSVADVDALTRALEGAAAGLMMIDPALASDLRAGPGTTISSLTPRQSDVLGLMAQGYANSAIAEVLSISDKSVENYVNAIYQRLDLTHGESSHARVTAVLRYLRESVAVAPAGS